VEAWSQGCEGIHLAGAQGQGSIGPLRRLTATWNGYGLLGCLNPRSCSPSHLGVSRITARRTARSDELRAVTWKGKAS